MQTITKFSSLHDSNQQSDTNAYSLVPATPSCSKFLYKNVVHFYILQYSLRTNVTHTLLSRIITTNLLTNIVQLCITKTYIDNVPYLTPLLAAEVWHKCNRNSFRSFANFNTDREAIFPADQRVFFSHRWAYFIHRARYATESKHYSTCDLRLTPQTTDNLEYFGLRSFVIQILSIYY